MSLAYRTYVIFHTYAIIVHCYLLAIWDVQVLENLIEWDRLIFCECWSSITTMEYGKPTEYEGKSFAPNVGAKHID